MGVAKITQANSYGVWGEDLTTLSYLKPSWKEDKFKFTGKEELPETGYTDFGARLYDKFVPRFITIDPLSEISRRFSPYTYANNNPLRFTDPDGMDAVDVNGGVMYTGDDAKNAYIELQKNRPQEEDPKKEKKYEYLGYSKEAKGYIQQVTNPDGSIYQQKYPFPAPGIRPDYTLEAILIPIFRPLGWAFNAMKFRFFAKVVTNAEVDNVIAEAVVEGVKSKGSDIALGLGDDLFNFAKTKQFQTYRDFSVGFEKDKILSAINNTNNNLHFNLTGFSKYQFSKFNPANPVTYRNITNWELNTILNNANALQRTTFYKLTNGVYTEVKNPF